MRDGRTSTTPSMVFSWWLGLSTAGGGRQAASDLDELWMSKKQECFR